MLLAQLAIGVSGVLAISGEDSTSLIRSTFTAASLYLGLLAVFAVGLGTIVLTDHRRRPLRTDPGVAGGCCSRSPHQSRTRVIKFLPGKAGPGHVHHYKRRRPIGVVEGAEASG